MTVLINEFFFDPATDLSGDANGDGVREASGDEFVEIVNTGPGSVDISGWTLSDDDASGAAFAFPAGTILAENEAAVLFGGGSPTGAFGGALVFTDDGTIGNSLANGGDLIELRDVGGVLIDSVGYGSAGTVTGGSDQSVTRDPDLTGSFVDHSAATGSSGALFSPGTQIDGSPFAGGSVDTTPPTVTSIDDDRGGGPIDANMVVTYTVTFDEDINAATVDAADFENTGTAPITIGGIEETSPGVFTVQVTPTAAGTLTLQIPAAGTIEDNAGNALATPVMDDTTITVNPDSTAPSVASIEDDRGGGPVEVNTLITYTVNFNEDIDAATVSAADFDNAGAAPITVGTITETSPGVFTVAVTPTDVGDLTLRIPAAAIINDTAGNPLAVPVSDDTTITVNPLSGIVNAIDDNYTTPQDTDLVTTAETGVLANDVIRLFHESFENPPGVTYTLNDAFDEGGFSFFDRYMVPDNSNVARDDFQTGFDGGFAIMGQDHDGLGGNATRTIAITGIDLSGAGERQLDVSLAALDSEPAFDNYEAAHGDGIRIFITIDGGTRTLIGEFAPPAMGGGGTANAGNLYLDTDDDGIGDGAALTTALQEFTFAIPSTGSLLDVEIELTSTDSFEPLVVDNVAVIASGVTGTAGNASTPTPNGGTVALNPDGSFTYTPAPGFNGTDSFTYDLTYASMTDTATVTLTVGTTTPPPTGLFLNEIVVAPDGADSPNEYIEIRGDAGQDLAGVFVVFVESDSGTTLGEVNNGATSSVDLTGHAIGTSGFLVILDDAADSYSVAAGTTIVDVPGMDFENASYTAFLIFIDPSTGTAPVVGQDLDTGDDGLDALPSGWTILDGVSVLDGGPDDRGYAEIVFSDDADGLTEPGATFVDTGFGGTDTVNHVMRIGDSTGSAASDWVAFDHDPGSTAPDFTIAQSTAPGYTAGQVITDHLGASNPLPSTSTTAIIDNGDPGYSSTGFHAIPDALFPDPEGRDGDIENSQKGTGADVATWTFSGLTAGTYRVSATWSSHENRATNAPYSIIDGAAGTLLVKTLVNQEVEPADFTDDGSAWQNLGIVTITGDMLIVELSDAADQYVIADAVRIEDFPTAPGPGPTSVDDGDVGYADSGWNVSPLLEGRQNDLRYQSAGNGSETARWTFTGLTPGNHTVAATWTPHANRASNAPYTMFDGTGGPLLEMVRVNQELDPDDFVDNGSSWEHLTVVTITGNEFVVELSNDANGFVIADAVRIEPTTEDPLPPGTIIDDGETGFLTTAGWFESLGEGRRGDVRYTGLGDGTRVATWTFTGLTPGMYRVSATWSAHANRATNAPYTIFDTATPLGTVEVNQQQAPDDFSTLGSDWEDLMTVEITDEVLVVTLSNNADGFIIADAVRIQPAP